MGQTLSGPVATAALVVFILSFITFFIPGFWPVSIFLIIFSAPLLLGTRGWEFDAKKKRYREYHWVWYMHLGRKWKSLTPYNTIIILNFSEAQVMNFISISRKVHARGYEVYMSDRKGKKEKIYEIYSYFKARKVVDQVAKALDFEINDRYEEQMQKILKNATLR